MHACTCVYARVCACTRVCMHACVHARVCACTRVCMHACVHARVCACTRVCVHARVCACTRVCMHACVHARVCACTCACMHARVCSVCTDACTYERVCTDARLPVYVHAFVRACVRALVTFLLKINDASPQKRFLSGRTFCFYICYVVLMFALNLLCLSFITHTRLQLYYTVTAIPQGSVTIICLYSWSNLGPTKFNSSLNPTSVWSFSRYQGRGGGGGGGEWCWCWALWLPPEFT